MKTNKKRVMLLCALPLATAATAKDSRPNIILICADDMGWSDLGCYGSEINTPTLDRLAESGLRFNNFHNTSKSFPSRACLITGLYAQQNGYSEGYKSPLTNAVTFGEVLREAGYRTLWSGKHHGAENPVTRGFDRYYGLRDGCCNYFNPGVQREGEGDPARKTTRVWCIDSVTYTPYTPVERDFYTTDYFTNYALDWLEEYSEEEKPFFLYLAYTAPHDPLMAWPEDIARYEGKYSDGYESIRKARYEKQLQSGVITDKWQLTNHTYAEWDKLTTEEQTLEQRRMEIYAAMIDRMDRNIGRIIDHLEKRGELDNTLILFMSDNGASAEIVNPKYLDSGKERLGKMGELTYWESLGRNWANVCNTPFKLFKNNSYEGGIATPLIVSWGDKIKRRGATVNDMGHFIDIMATLCDVANADYPTEYNGNKITPLEGESLLPVIKGKKRWERERPIFWEWGTGAAVNDGTWKIVRLKPDDAWSLYNVANDPTESRDLSSEHPDIVQRMDQMFSDWKEHVS